MCITIYAGGEICEGHFFLFIKHFIYKSVVIKIQIDDIVKSVQSLRLKQMPTVPASNKWDQAKSMH